MKKITTIFAGILLSIQGFSQWSLTGNAGTNPAVNFLGTTDAQRLVFRTNNVERMTILSTGRVGIGTSTPGVPLQIVSTTDNFLRLSGTGPSIQFFGDTTSTTKLGKLAYASGTNQYVGGSVAGDFILQNIDTVGSLIFGTSFSGGNGLERMRITSSGYAGIATAAPTAKLHVNCIAIAGKTNPSNIRFQNLQSGSGSFLVIDSNGYVYKASSGTTAATSTRPEALNVDLQNEIENLKNQVQELRSLIVSRGALSPVQANNLKAESATWLGDNTPNPFNGSTNIEYSLPAGVTAASCQIYSLDGKLINAISLTPAAGKGQVRVGTGKMVSGMYIYSLIVNGKVADTKKMVVSN